MATLEGLVRVQRTTAVRIQRLTVNMLKLGKEKLTLTVVKKRQELLDVYWKEFMMSHKEIVRLPEADSDPYMTEDLYTQVEEAYLDQSAALEELIQDRESADPSLKPGSLTRSSTLDLETEPALPPMGPLPTFSGNLMDWESFRDQFRSVIHSSTRLSKARKLQYLKSSLAGEAARMLDRTPVTNDQYDGAWESLERRYGNPRVLATANMRRLVQCAPVTKGKTSEIKRLLDEFSQARQALKALEKPVAIWDEWFLFLMTEKLDSSTRLQWELSLKKPTETPKLRELEDFLETRLHAITAAQESSRSSTDSAPAAKARDTQGRSSAASTRTTMPVKVGTAAPVSKAKVSRQCLVCKGNHSVSYCSQYKPLRADERKSLIQRLGACMCCLSVGHVLSSCPSVHRCLVCDGRHHTTLHDAFRNSEGELAGPSLSSPFPTATTSSAAYSVCVGRPILLATAQVQLKSPEGRTVVVRALFDCGSETSFMSDRVATLLGLEKIPVNVSLSGYQGFEVGVARHEVQVVLGSLLDSSFHLPVHALVTPSVTSPSPSQYINVGEWPHIRDLPLADQDFWTPAPIDLLLGADVFGLLCADRRVGPPGTPVAICTPFGWVLLGSASSKSDGKVPSPAPKVLHVRCCEVLDAALQRAWTLEDISSPRDTGAGEEIDSVFRSSVFSTNTARVSSSNCCAVLSDELLRFWEVEELPSHPSFTPEELQCEQHFLATHSRDDSGRYVVRLPFRTEANLPFRGSRAIALRLLLSSERRQLRDPSLKESYTRFMEEYLRLDHMESVDTGGDSPSSPSLYLPHHAVWKINEIQQSAKIRVVFNASFTSSAGTSLNDLLLSGPKLQQELWLILTRWRCFRFAFSADVVKMFRQIRMHRDDRDWQRILWRPSPEDEVQDFRLSTVTYGTSPAPFLALRTLQQLAHDERQRFPLGSQILERHRYVDDILAGADDPGSLVEVRRQLTDLLAAGGFPLDKWATNSGDLGMESDTDSKLLKEKEAHGALGLLWNTRHDTLAVRGPEIPVWPSERPWTKRAVLSEIARLFDPVGWLAPVLVRAKIFIQDLWLAGVDWDEPLPEVLSVAWTTFRQCLSQLGQVSVPRWVGCNQNENFQLELHGFCDASERAYAATVFLLVRSPDKTAQSHLLMAKTKVAPIKVVSIPRLELCGALLLTKLMVSLRKGLECSQVSLFGWSDSTVTLDWIQAHASRWPTFVANRVGEIQRILPEMRWRYARSIDNPADLATRGISPEDLKETSLWWHGPSWLAKPSSEWPTRKETLVSPNVHVGVVSGKTWENDYLIRFSSYSRLLRVTARILRLFANVRSPGQKRSGFLTSAELEAARIVICRCSQRETFVAELEALARGDPVRVSSLLASCHPFLDKDGLIRVGGRLKEAQVPPEEKHPVVISRESHLSVLLIRYTHLRLLHAGVNLTTCHLFRRYWIPRGHVLVKQVVGACTTCRRYQGIVGRQIMGNLPPERVTPAKAFSNSGVDFAGPILLRTTKGRGHRAYKGYISVFVCLCTKAVHLEAVSDLTTSAFIAAFHRFTARRGRCSSLRSDNATNFKGADSQLKAMFKAASHFHQESAELLANDGTDWTFNPPCAPHHGGLWEAAVKSVKTHLRKVMRAQTLTFEEMTTLLCQIEACLNSRPLCPLSSDPNSFEPLTPGHFLTGEPLTAVPEPCPLDPIPTSISSRWKLISILRNNFWYRWRVEYLHLLQQRSKWRRPTSNLEKDALVLIKDELTPPTKWPLARILEVCPGTDGLVRVVKLRTASSTLLRPISRVIPLLEASSDQKLV